MPAEVGFKKVTGLLQLIICLAEHKADQVPRRIWTSIKRADRQHCDPCLCRHALTEGHIILFSPTANHKPWTAKDTEELIQGEEHNSR